MEKFHAKPIVDIDRRNASSAPFVCYPPTMIPVGSVWSSDINPLDYSFPLFLLQLVLIVLTTRATHVVIRPFRQPRYIAEIIGGLLLGPTVMGRIPSFHQVVFPFRSVLELEAMSQLGLIYFIFIIGIEMEPSSVRKTGRSMVFAAACMVVPFVIGSVSGLASTSHLRGETSPGSFLVFLGAALSITSFSVLAHTLAELKILHTPVGSAALSSAVLIDTCAWILVTLALSLAQSGGNPAATLWTMLSGVAFFGALFLVVKPAVLWVVARTPEGEEVGELPTCTILVGALVAALVAEVIGFNAISGAFVYGLVIPHGQLGGALIEQVEGFVGGLLLPLFFAMCGLRTDLWAVRDTEGAAVLVAVVMLAGLAKVVGCMVVGFLYHMPPTEGLAMGLLMNTKGVIEMVILNVGRDKEVLSDHSFSILVLISLVGTATLSPLLVRITKLERGSAPYERRNVQWRDPEAELRVLAAVHTTRNVPSFLALLHALHPSKRAPVSVLALHLIELTGRASAIPIIHHAAAVFPSSSSAADDPPLGPTSLSRLRARSDHIFRAFESFGQRSARSGGVSVIPLTAVSPYHTMHEDICGVALHRRAALIVLPFHKQQTVDGGLEAINPALRSLNQSVLASAPCAVAILVDRGFGGAARLPDSADGDGPAHQVAVAFLGGPDDREALALASRMAGHPAVSVTVFHIGPPDHSGLRPQASDGVLNVDDGDERERWMDEDCVAEFRLRHAGDESVVYEERTAGCAAETVAVIREIDSIHDLYIVGRGSEAAASPERARLTAGLNEWSECPELGPIGDMLASTDFGATASVLVVRQYCHEGPPSVEAVAAAASLGKKKIMHVDSPKAKIRNTKGSLSLSLGGRV